MAAAMPPDDVSALMSRVELNRSQYKVFDGRHGSHSESGIPSRPVFHTNGRMTLRGAVPANEAAVPAQDATRPRWNVLNSLLAPGDKNPFAVTPEALLVPMLAFSAGSGGVGKTTVLSTVARILAGMGESLFLVYSESQRALPAYFGGQQVVPGRVRTFIPPVRDFGHLHLYARPQNEVSAVEDVSSWLPREVNALSSEVGRVLCEVSSVGIIERRVFELASINLRILVPDINSVLTVNRDLAELEPADESHRTFYLLNKFDPTVSFHRDVRERLRAVLGDRLLPFAIRRTDLIPEALASASTIVDYAPTAPVIDDFNLFAQWLRNSMQRNAVEPMRSIL